MTIANVALTDTFDTWRLVTNQVVTSLNENLLYFSSNNAPLTITQSSPVAGNIYIQLALSNVANDTSTSKLATAAAVNGLSNIVSTLNSHSYGVASNTKSAYDFANSTYVVANSGYRYANSLYDIIVPSYAVANIGHTTANAAYTSVNAAYTTVNAAYTSGNAAYATVNAAFFKANTGPVLTNDIATNATYYVTFTNQTTNAAILNVATSKLTFNPSTGTLSSTNYNSLSDAELKTNIQPITDALDIIEGISGVGFTWKDTGRPSFGVIAQDIEKTIPALVDHINNNKTVNYDGIIAFLIEAIKELNAKIENK